MLSEWQLQSTSLNHINPTDLAITWRGTNAMCPTQRPWPPWVLTTTARTPQQMAPKTPQGFHGDAH